MKNQIYIRHSEQYTVWSIAELLNSDLRLCVNIFGGSEHKLKNGDDSFWIGSTNSSSYIGIEPADTMGFDDGLEQAFLENYGKLPKSFFSIENDSSQESAKIAIEFVRLFQKHHPKITFMWDWSKEGLVFDDNIQRLQFVPDGTPFP